MIKEFIDEKINFTIKQWIAVICIVAVIGGVFGWLYEVLFYYLDSGFKVFYMRGANYLPWINIYMYGSFLILFLTLKLRKHPLQVFLVSAISTGILEYLTGLILYGYLGWRVCWDYNQEILNFGNIGGYVCLRSVTIFGICGLLLIYVVMPILKKLVTKVNMKVVLPISIILCSIFLLDEIYNLLLYPYFPIPKASDFYKEHGLKYKYFSE